MLFHAAGSRTVVCLMYATRPVCGAQQQQRCCASPPRRITGQAAQIAKEGDGYAQRASEVVMQRAQQVLPLPHTFSTECLQAALYNFPCLHLSGWLFGRKAHISLTNVHWNYISSGCNTRLLAAGVSEPIITHCGYLGTLLMKPQCCISGI